MLTVQALWRRCRAHDHSRMLYEYALSQCSDRILVGMVVVCIEDDNCKRSVDKWVRGCLTEFADLHLS